MGDRDRSADPHGGATSSRPSILYRRHGAPPGAQSVAGGTGLLKQPVLYLSWHILRNRSTITADFLPTREGAPQDWIAFMLAAVTETVMTIIIRAMPAAI
jgi:hypothetical protein